MKEQYQKEVSQIHVPEELLKKTKQAMKEEEKALAREKKTGKTILFKRISLAAAAVLLLVLIPTGMSFFGGRNQSKDGGQMQMQLGNQADPEIVKVGQGGEKVLTVKEVDRMPEQFEGADETVIGDMVVRVTADGETGYLEAYYEREEKAYTVTSTLVDLREFEEALGEELK